MLRLRNRNGNAEIFDPVRRKWVRKTEEELVRQHIILYLIQEKEIPISHISVEKEIKMNGLSRRYDIIVFDKECLPYMVIECKAPHVKITQEVVEQVGRYNKTLRAPIIGVTNGETNLFFKINFETDEIEEVNFWNI